MDIYKAPTSIRTLGIWSLALGALGGAFCWWTPLGMVLSIAGWLIGFVGWIYSPWQNAVSRMAIGGMVLSVITLILNLVIAYLGLEIFKFGEL